MAFGAGTAWMKELSAQAPVGAGARRAAVSLSAGFGCGALFAGVVAQWLPAPQVSPYVVHIALMIAALALVWPVPETRTVRTAPAATRVTALSKAPFLRGVVPGHRGCSAPRPSPSRRSRHASSSHWVQYRSRSPERSRRSP